VRPISPEIRRPRSPAADPVETALGGRHLCDLSDLKPRPAAEAPPFRPARRPVRLPHQPFGQTTLPSTNSINFRPAIFLLTAARQVPASDPSRTALSLFPTATPHLRSTPPPPSTVAQLAHPLRPSCKSCRLPRSYSRGLPSACSSSSRVSRHSPPPSGGLGRFTRCAAALELQLAEGR
jgi:hypothetical protein